MENSGDRRPEPAPAGRPTADPAGHGAGAHRAGSGTSRRAAGSPGSGRVSTTDRVQG